MEIAQDSIGIAPAVKHARDKDFLTGNLENDRHPALKTHCPQPQTDIVTAGSAFGKRGKRHAGCFDPVDVAAGNDRTSLIGDVILEIEEIRFRLGTKTDGEFHLSSAFMRWA